MMIYRHYVQKMNWHWMAFDETDSCVGTFKTRRAALKCVRAHFKKLGDDYILNFKRNLGI